MSRICSTFAVGFEIVINSFIIIQSAKLQKKIDMSKSFVQICAKKFLLSIEVGATRNDLSKKIYNAQTLSSTATRLKKEGLGVWQVFNKADEKFITVTRLK